MGRNWGNPVLDEKSLISTLTYTLIIYLGVNYDKPTSNRPLHHPNRIHPHFPIFLSYFGGCVVSKEYDRINGICVCGKKADAFKGVTGKTFFWCNNQDCSTVSFNAEENPKENDICKNWIAFSKHQNSYFPTQGSFNDLKIAFSKGDKLLEIPNNLKWIEL